MKKACVIGKPVSHSLSPNIFEFLAKSLGQELEYEKFVVEPDQLADFVKGCKVNADVVGFNVTVPHKNNIVLHLDAISVEVRPIGASNVVAIQDQMAKGFNTDCFGVEQTLTQHQVSVKGKNVVVFGAGGAARAVLYALGRYGAQNIFVVNRTEKKAQDLVSQMGKVLGNAKCAVSLQPVDAPISLFINTTTLGMKGVSGKIPEFFEGWTADPQASAFDVIYNPEKTPFLEQAEKLNMKTIGGLDMLIYQALATWEIWFGPNDRLNRLVPELRAYLRGLL